MYISTYMCIYMRTYLYRYTHVYINIDICVYIFASVYIHRNISNVEKRETEKNRGEKPPVLLRKDSSWWIFA